MAFVINKRGERVSVDLEVDWFSQTVPLYEDDADLFEFWLLNLYKGKEIGNLNSECELIKQVEFRHNPTKDEMMYELWKHGLSRYDFVTVEHGWKLDWPQDY